MTEKPPSEENRDASAPAFVFDEALELPPIPHPLQPLAGPAGALILEHDAEARPICLAGRRALLLGSERQGIAEVHIHPIPVLTDLETGLAP